MITPSDDKMRCTVVAIDGGRDSNIGASVDTGNGIKVRYAEYQYLPEL